MPLTAVARSAMMTWAFTTGTPTTRPVAWWLALFSAVPNDNGTTLTGELSGSGYSRVALTSTSLLSGTAGVISNAAGAIAALTATGALTVLYAGIIDTSSGAGNVWAYFPVSQSGATYYINEAQAANPGSGYAVNDTITLTAGTGTSPVLTVKAVATVNAVAGVVTQVAVTTPGAISATPNTNPLATTTSGSGSGFTALAAWLETPTSFALNSGDTLSFATSTVQIGIA